MRGLVTAGHYWTLAVCLSVSLRRDPARSVFPHRDAAIRDSRGGAWTEAPVQALVLWVWEGVQGPRLRACFAFMLFSPALYWTMPGVYRSVNYQLPSPFLGSADTSPFSSSSWLRWPGKLSSFPLTLGQPSTLVSVFKIQCCAVLVLNMNF